MGMWKTGIQWVSRDSHGNGNKISHGMGIGMGMGIKCMGMGGKTRELSPVTWNKGSNAGGENGNKVIEMGGNWYEKSVPAHLYSVAEWLACWISGAEGPGFKSQPRRCRETVLGKLFTPIVPLFTKQQNW